MGFVPEQTAAPALEAGELFALKLAEPLPPRRISLLEYEGHTLSLAARRLRDMLLCGEGGESAAADAQNVGQGNIVPA